MKWHVNFEYDHGKGNKVNYDAVFTTEGYKLVLEAAFQACRKPGGDVIARIQASNLEGMTQILEGMHWSRDSLYNVHEAEHLASEMYYREVGA